MMDEAGDVHARVEIVLEAMVESARQHWLGAV